MRAGGVVAERLKKNGARAEVDLFASDASGVLPSAPREQQASAAARLERLGVNVVAGARATAVRGVVGEAEAEERKRKRRADLLRSIRTRSPRRRARGARVAGRRRRRAARFV